MGNWVKTYEEWNTYENLDPTLRRQLHEMENDKSALEDAFYKELTFGTGGMRGVLGPGTNRMNIYTVRKAIHGYAKFLINRDQTSKARGIVIAYDSRHMSQEFAIEAAKVLGKHEIKTYIFQTIQPTPLLSFAVRYLQTNGGIMITASHNPPEYNGFKIYNEDGGQITLEDAESIIQYVQTSEEGLTLDIPTREALEEQGLLHWLVDEVQEAYLKQLITITKMDQQKVKQPKDLKVVFTPLHGTAYELVTKGLKQLNFDHIYTVKEQAEPNGDFPTVQLPNPEEAEAFERAIQEGKKHDADLLLATDPDADRLGIAVKNKNEDYELLTGNQLGALILYYLLENSPKEALANGRMLKTIVTSELGRAIAHDYGVETVDTLTGFKFIGEKIRKYDSTGEKFIFGYEESYGYLIKGFARDKDAVQAAVMTCEMAQYWKERGKTLLDALEILYKKYGYYLESLTSLTLEGIEGAEKISKIMTTMRNEPLQRIADLNVVAIEDYLISERKYLKDDNRTEKIHLPKENVVKFLLEENSWVCLRPSGTEPKLKCYYGVQANAYETSKKCLQSLKNTMEEIIEQFLSS